MLRIAVGARCTLQAGHEAYRSRRIANTQKPYRWLYLELHKTLSFVILRKTKKDSVVRVLAALFVFVFLPFVGPSLANAQAVGEGAQCSTAVALMDSPDKDKQSEVVNDILASMSALDQAYASKGKSEILTKMTEEGRKGLALLVVSRCEKLPDLSLDDMAFDTYQGVRAMQGSLGFNEPSRPQVKPVAQSDPRPVRKRLVAPVRRQTRIVNRIAQRPSYLPYPPCGYPQIADWVSQAARRI